MKQASLITSHQVFLVGDRIRQIESLPPEVDVLIGPSLTFRKNFEIPRTIDQSPRKLKMKAFSRFLPDDIDKFTCQFITESSGSGQQKRVSGFGIANDKLDRLKNQLDESAEIYFLETLLTNPYPDTKTEIELAMPEGSLMAHFRSESLIWSHFRQRQEDKNVITPAYLPKPDREFSTTPFPEDLEGSQSESWTKDFWELLSDDPPIDRSLATHSLRSLWDQVKGLTYTAVVLLFVTLLGWIGVMRYSNSLRRAWLRSEYEKLTGDSSQRPYRELRTKLETLRAKVPEEPSQQTREPLYTVVPSIDSLFSESNIELLTLELSRDSLEVTFLSPSLEEAEQFRNSLQSRASLRNPSIINSETTTDDDYGYEIDLHGELILK